MLAGRIEEFSHLSQFKDIKDLNNNVEMFLSIHHKDFTKSELIAFKRLTKYMAKVKGVANAKIQTLVKATHTIGGLFGGVSRSTFERMLRKAKKLGILKVENTTKLKGGKGHNVYILQRFDALKEEKLTHCENEAKPCTVRDNQTKNSGETSNLYKTNNNNNTNHSMPYTQKRKIIKYVPRFLQHFQSHFEDNILQMYRRVILAGKNYLIESKEMINEVAVYTFNSMLKYARSKSLDQLQALTYTIALERFKTLAQQEYDELIDRLHAGEFILKPIDNWLD